MITADQAIATAQQWEAEKAAGPSALVGRALLAHINSLASPQVTDEQIEGADTLAELREQVAVFRVRGGLQSLLSAPPAAETPVAWTDDQMIRFASMILIQGNRPESIEMRLQTFRQHEKLRGNSRPEAKPVAADGALIRFLGRIAFHETVPAGLRVEAKRLLDEAQEQAPAARDVLAERQRQKDVEGWTPEHDDEHSSGELVAAAICYAQGSNQWHSGSWEIRWPWSIKWWKPRDRRRNLIRAGALMLAEIERIDRADLQSQPQQVAKGGDE